MKKVFTVLITRHSADNPKSRKIFCAHDHFTTRKSAQEDIKHQKEFDKTLSGIWQYRYYIFEGLVITKEKINEIITNSNVQ